MSDSRRYWVGFNLVKGIGAARLKRLLDYFGDVTVAWHASPDALHQAGLGQKLVDSMLQVRGEVDLEMVWDGIQRKGINVLTWEDQGYPRRLKEIDQPPPVLYMLGDLLPEDEWAVAIVGTRRMTAYGRHVTEEISGTLVQNGITVISGLARGIDVTAHQAALNAGGRTLAVLGSGVDIINPGEHRRLADKIVKSGALIGDYPPGTPPESVNFPPRNRIISGLALAVVIVEAGAQSGALITAGFAADQGRDVFAVPGNITAPQSAGTNRLIQQGAFPFTSVKDLMEILNLAMIPEKRQARIVLPANDLESKLLDLLSNEPLHVDDLRSQSDLPIEKVTATLVIMELKGMVRQVGNMNYMAIREPSDSYSTDASDRTQSR